VDALDPKCSDKGIHARSSCCKDMSKCPSNGRPSFEVAEVEGE
jgi:hypothetical protein